MIPQSKIEEILNAANIEEVVGDYVRLKRRGANLTGLCPFHNEKTPSFSVSPAKGIFKCFGCGKAGNAVNFVMEHDSLSYIEALRNLADRYRIEWPQQENVNIDQERALRSEKESLQILNNWAADFFEKELWESEEGKNIGLSYFEERGFRTDIIKKFRLGYSHDSWDSFTNAATNQQFSQEVLVKGGLVKQNEGGKVYDAYRGRVMFIIHGSTGKIIAFAGRQLKKDDKSAKYVNSPETLLYHKSNELYGLFFAKNAIRQNDFVYLVEGYTDVISMHQAGVENVVASSGTSLTENQIRLIKRHTDNVTVLYDGDAAGIKASLRGIDMLLEQGLNVKVLLFPDGDDPDSYSKKVGSEAFQEYLQKETRDFILFKVNLLLKDAEHDPLKKAQVTRDIVESISKIPDGIKRMAFIRECAVLLDMNEQLLIAELNKSRSGFLTQKEKEWISEQPKEVPHQEELAQIMQGSPTYDQEQYIVKLLLLHGHKPAPGYSNVAEYIIRKMDAEEIGFEHEVMRLMLQEFRSLLLNQTEFTTQTFTQSANTIVSTAAANLLAVMHEMSSRWVSKYDITMEHPDDIFLKDVESALLYLEKYNLNKMLDQVQAELKLAQDNNAEADLNLNMEVYKLVKQKQQELSHKIGAVILH
ncbi:MAG: DNA primase [Bacteroidetes bacterium B1(2017)]|nr:MAG: DNA primase [Bacteroidetes bacterium B1(2017)]